MAVVATLDEIDCGLLGRKRSGNDPLLGIDGVWAGPLGCSTTTSEDDTMDSFAFVGPQAQLFGLSHMYEPPTLDEVRQFVAAAGPATTSCLLCGADAGTDRGSCSHLNDAWLAKYSRRRSACLLTEVAIEIRFLCSAYYGRLFSNALKCPWPSVYYDETDLGVLQIHWQGGLSLSDGIVAAGRLVPDFMILGYRTPNGVDARRAAQYLEGLRPGCTVPLRLKPAQVAGLSQRCWEFSEFDSQPWFNFELGACGTLHECFRHLYNGESTVLPAITEEDIIRGLAHADAGVRAFSRDL